MTLKKRTENAFVSAALALIFGVLAPAFSEVTYADASVQITTAKVASGEQASWFQCPCFRWVVQFQAASGQIETRQFLISSEALLNVREETMMDFQRYAVRMFKVGSLEALWKGGHVGLGFKGVSWGKDRDRGYSDLLRTGLYGLVNLVRTEALRLDIRSGYDFESMRVNLGPQLENHRLDQAAVLRWRAGNRWSGDVTAHVGLDATQPTTTETMNYGASTDVQFRIIDFHGLRLGTSLEVAFEHDGFRGDLGLEPNLVSETIMMSLSYVPGAR